MSIRSARDLLLILLSYTKSCGGWAVADELQRMSLWSATGYLLILLSYRKAPADELRRMSSSGCLSQPLKVFRLYDYLSKSSGGWAVADELQRMSIKSAGHRLLILLSYRIAAADELRRMSSSGSRRYHAYITRNVRFHAFYHSIHVHLIIN
jgi:hypothetical protein